MPLPSPNAGEKRNKFISRCMSNGGMQSEFPRDDQRVAVCISQWKRKGKTEDSRVTSEEIDQALRDYLTFSAK